MSNSGDNFSYTKFILDMSKPKLRRHRSQIQFWFIIFGLCFVSWSSALYPHYLPCFDNLDLYGRLQITFYTQHHNMYRQLGFYIFKLINGLALFSLPFADTEVGKFE